MQFIYILQNGTYRCTSYVYTLEAHRTLIVIKSNCELTAVSCSHEVKVREENITCVGRCSLKKFLPAQGTELCTSEIKIGWFYRIETQLLGGQFKPLLDLLLRPF